MAIQAPHNPYKAAGYIEFLFYGNNMEPSLLDKGPEVCVLAPFHAPLFVFT